MRTTRNATALAAMMGAACLTAPPMLAAQEVTVVPPEPIELPMPEPPPRQFGPGPGPEGWVKLRYSVTAQGSTTNVRVVEAMPPHLDTSNVVAVVGEWQFAPASDRGEPIEWHNNVTVIAFNEDGAAMEATQFFAEAYEEVAELLSAERYSRAKSRNESMQREVAFRLYELGLAQVQLAALELAMENRHAAFDAIRRATEPNVRQLPDDELKAALEYRFALGLELGRVMDALATYARRTELEPVPPGDPMAVQAAAIEQALQNEETSLAIQGRIDPAGPWQHDLARRTFAVGDVDGRIQEIEVECNRRKAVLPFEADVEVTIPESWGECALFVSGRRNTTFTLYEFN